MKSGKIILGAAAAVVTVGSSLAFNAAHKFGTHKKIIGWTKENKALCKTCHSIWTLAAGAQLLTIKNCHTGLNGAGDTLVATKTAHVQVRTRAWHTKYTLINGQKCLSAQITNVTTVK